MTESLFEPGMVAMIFSTGAQLLNLDPQAHVRCSSKETPSLLSSTMILFFTSLLSLEPTGWGLFSDSRVSNIW